MKDLADMRRDYILRTLNETDVDSDPFRQFHKWFQEAIASNVLEPNAMTLATVTPDSRPQARVVLLKNLTPDGLIFYTNYHSAKGIALDQNPFAALVFQWLELERQVRIEGRAEKVSRSESEKYFHSRPRMSQISAYVSPQSQVISGKEEMEQKWVEADKLFLDAEITVPENWGGYLVRPDMFEFWQGRNNRLHDRLQYIKNESAWKIQRLAP